MSRHRPESFDLPFRCPQCRTHGQPMQGWVDGVLRTGRAHLNNGLMSREYSCIDCGHAGWSRHPDLEKARHIKAESGH